MSKKLKNNNENKQKFKILIGIVTLLVLVLGVAYAYFQIIAKNNNSSAALTGKTPVNSLLTLKNVTSNLHLNINVSDMSLMNANKEYFGTDDENPYVDNETDGTKTISQIELSGEEEATIYNCTAKLTVSKVTSPEDQKDTMIDILEKGDMILQFKGNIINEQLDLSTLKNANKQYDLNFKIIGNKTEDIQAYIKLLNKATQQNYLAGNSLNIDIKTSDLKCEIGLPDPKIAQLREKDTQNYLSPSLQGGMYRYQAAFEEGDSSEMTNWICFGSTKNCGTSDDLIDKYMYRIIGITPVGEMYLIKETFLTEEETSSFSWDSKYYTSGGYEFSCDGKICPEWGQNNLFKRINGISNGKIQGSGTYSDNADTDIFVNSIEYDYLKSGDDDNEESLASYWYDLIEDHQWLYGDTYDINLLNRYNGDAIYQIESGKNSTIHYVGFDGSNKEETYKWTNRVNGKIGLMYIHDYYYSYYDGSNELTRGNAGNNINLKNSWIYFQKDGYNTSISNEWFSTRAGLCTTSDTFVNAYFVTDTGVWSYNVLNNINGVRPVFYLKSSVKITDGDGTKTNPYILA